MKYLWIMLLLILIAAFTVQASAAALLSRLNRPYLASSKRVLEKFGKDFHRMMGWVAIFVLVIFVVRLFVMILTRF